ncbi:ABC transporter substrate-binding protein [Sorangium cellulosum]|uniref:ABC transporter substrate-binding protein n=1 Tax=Sorangium cellulosum TaxID=56 RepID=A0A2L0EZQ1_SORCE|nr:ABC transporter substrate-binding protein [Sorangium cellulosum]AUX44770.1 ABC transporter substrate-binding protein [Sorangium cellulosum]
MDITRQHDLRAWRTIALLLFVVGLCACQGDKKPPAGESRPGAAATATSKPAVAEAPGDTAIKAQPPAVPNAAEAKKFSGAKLKYYSESVGVGAELDRVLIKQFNQDTGIEVALIPRPKDATETYSVYQRLFQGQSADIDVLMLDVIWPGAFAQNLLDLREKLGEAAKQHVESIVQNNTVDGKLVAMPWFTDFGLLYYRTDLLEKYGYSKPPETWDELEQMAKKIQDGERASSPNFLGFVWQGKAYEGLTCNALEWIASHGGGAIIEDGKITVNNPGAQKALARAKGWVGTISSAGVTSYEEEDARNTFQGGNAAFMRNWPYAYAAGNADKSPIKGKFGVAPLPHEPGQKSAGAVGGWQLAVSKFSAQKDAAIELVRYLTSPEAQKFRATAGSFIPTVRSVQEDPDVVKSMPFLSRAKDIALVPRPSNSTGARYNEASIAFFQGVSQVLQGKDPKEVLGQVEQRLTRALR